MAPRGAEKKDVSTVALGAGWLLLLLLGRCWAAAGLLLGCCWVLCWLLGSLVALVGGLVLVRVYTRAPDDALD